VTTSRGHVAEAIDWQLPQNVTPNEIIHLSSSTSYGFLNRHSGYLKNVAYTENEVNELGDEAETAPPQARRARREAHEDDKFDDQYYMYVLCTYLTHLKNQSN
jgi:protein SHQ1